MAGDAVRIRAKNGRGFHPMGFANAGVSISARLPGEALFF